MLQAIETYLVVISSHRGVSVRKQLAPTPERRQELQIKDILRYDPFQTRGLNDDMVRR